jgi:hypothetical protein
MVLPMFEEVFYLAAQHERVSAVTRLYAPPFQTLARVHDKGSFQELCAAGDPHAADRPRPQRRRRTRLCWCRLEERHNWDFAVLGQIFQEPLKEVPQSIHDLATIHGTDRGWHDAMPKLYSFLALARFEKLSLGQREQLFVAMADGITWDGQSIPGLPADDAAYLEKLTG